MYLAYMDESETKVKRERWKVLCAVLVQDSYFSVTELISSLEIENLMPEERRKDFAEFHACELYGGFGPFDGIEQTKRFNVIESLLGLISQNEIKVTYGAVDVEHLQKQPYASANPLDFAFRICVEEIGKWLVGGLIAAWTHTPMTQLPLALLIVDECDKADKVVLHNSFRAMRKRMRPPDYDPGLLGCLHDDMYFGDSRYSIGIQIADLCAYFIARHLAGDDETERFYKMIEPHIFSSERAQEPELSSKDESAQ